MVSSVQRLGLMLHLRFNRCVFSLLQTENGQKYPSLVGPSERDGLRCWQGKHEVLA